MPSSEMTERIIETEADIAEGTAVLTAACPHMAGVHAVTGPPPLRRRPAGFAGLARIITGQQLSIASAGAIWGRLEQRVAPFEPAVLQDTPDADLRAAGLSAGKIAALRGIAQALTGGDLDLRTLEGAPEAEVRARLTALKGVGPWTTDIYTMFCLGRADAWAPGDLALRYAVEDACALKATPDEKRMVRIAETWRPWRGVAARLLWAYYRVRRQPSSGAPV